MDCFLFVTLIYTDSQWSGTAERNDSLTIEPCCKTRGKREMGRHTRENERYIIETMLEDKKSVSEIAERLGKHINTIYGEIRRGTVELVDTNLKPYTVYKADVGQRIHDERSHNKGIGLKIGNDHKTAGYIEKMVLEHRYSPYALSVALRGSDEFMTLSFKTIYNYIHSDVFLNVSDENLTYKVSRKTGREKTKRPSRNKLGARTIDERPDEIKDRARFGDWEMDTVYSGKGTTKECLLVLTERMTRHEIIRKMVDRTAQSVLDEINSLENILGHEKFRNTFRTITCDNGVEFSKFKEIELSCQKIGKRTSLYFCHPFCSCERGSNENANKLIRKFIPKGADISQYSDAFIKEMETMINNYPRKLFDGLSSNEYMRAMNIQFNY